MNNFYKGVVLLLLSAFGFSLLPIFALFAYRGGINITTLLFIRFTLAAGLLFVYVLIKYKRVPVNMKDLFYLFILGAIGNNLQARFYFSSVKYIPASLAALLLYTYPMLVTALAFFVDKEKITKKLGAAIGISFIGLIMILGSSFGRIKGLGILFALGASFVYSIYIVLGNRVIKDIPPAAVTCFISLFSSVGIVATGVFTEGINFNFTAVTWFPIIGLILFSTVLSMLTFFHGMGFIGPAKASIISMTEPVYTVILSTILLHDSLTAFQLMGGIIVLIGSTLVILSRENKSTSAARKNSSDSSRHSA